MKWFFDKSITTTPLRRSHFYDIYSISECSLGLHNECHSINDILSEMGEVMAEWVAYSPQKGSGMCYFPRFESTARRELFYINIVVLIRYFKLS